MDSMARLHLPHCRIWTAIAFCVSGSNKDCCKADQPIGFTLIDTGNRGFYSAPSSGNSPRTDMESWVTSPDRS